MGTLDADERSPCEVSSSMIEVDPTLDGQSGGQLVLPQVFFE